ncbi:MAG: DUF3786 domain-containing protein [Candidatus Omnitrophica bacterium]|jgi:hypothetical protein|nr:DUF3786 domain-containing protein [Candidatus Omnitrophota bacterium]
MGYQAAKDKAWNDLGKLTSEKNFSLRFLADEYSIDLEKKSVISLSCNVPAKDFSVIIILHYLIEQIKGLPVLAGVWLTFRELAGVEGYAAAFRKRAIEPLIRKYGRNPENIFSLLTRLPARKADFKDVSIIIEAFSGVPVLLKLFRSDEEFGSDANILFDKSITSIFCTEDIIVLAQIIAGSV